MNKNTNYKKCPSCDSILTPWPEGFVCDCCGYGKHSSDEFDKLQSEVRNR